MYLLTMEIRHFYRRMFKDELHHNRYKREIRFEIQNFSSFKYNCLNI